MTLSPAWESVGPTAKGLSCSPGQPDHFDNILGTRNLPIALQGSTGCNQPGQTFGDRSSKGAALAFLASCRHGAACCQATSSPGQQLDAGGVHAKGLSSQRDNRVLDTLLSQACVKCRSAAEEAHVLKPSASTQVNAPADTSHSITKINRQLLTLWVP